MKEKNRSKKFSTGKSSHDKRTDKKKIGNKKNNLNTIATAKKVNKVIPEKTEIISGIHSIREAIKAGKRKFYKILISSSGINKRIKKIIRSAESIGVPVEFTDTEFLDTITENVQHQGVAARVSPFSVTRIKEVMRQIKSNPENKFILIIENLEDPHNFGALVRTAMCAGVDYIFIPKDRSVAPLPSVSRASAGAMEHASITLITNTASIIKTLKNNGFWIAGLDANGTSPLFQADLTGNLALVVGGEHKGLRPLVKKECDFILSLPMAEGKVSSLNASVAGGIAMYEVLRQRSVQQ